MLLIPFAKEEIDTLVTVSSFMFKGEKQDRYIKRLSNDTVEKPKVN
jgi:hypothetical protein